MMLVSQHWRRADMPTTISGWNTNFPRFFCLLRQFVTVVCCAAHSHPVLQTSHVYQSQRLLARRVAAVLKSNLIFWRCLCHDKVIVIRLCQIYFAVVAVLIAFHLMESTEYLKKFCSCFTSKKVLIRTVLDALFPTYTCPSVICTTCGTALYGMSCCFEYGLLCHDVVSGTACENGCG